MLVGLNIKQFFFLTSYIFMQRQNQIKCSTESVHIGYPSLLG